MATLPQSTKKHRDFFREHFEYVVRFQDDRWDADSQYIAKALYVEEKWDEDRSGPPRWHGIYPKCYLKLTMEATDFDFIIHQDVAVRRVPVEGADGMPISYYYFTDVYDKKFDTKFDDIRQHMVLYQLPDTQLADQCIYGVVYSEMLRFSNRCTREEDFVKATTRMTTEMLKRGYHPEKVKLRVRRFVEEVPQLFYRNASGEWRKKILDSINATREKLHNLWAAERVLNFEKHQE